MHRLPEISIIVCCYNHDKWIERCIRSLSHQRNVEPEEYEIILIDDASTDDSAAVYENLNVLSNLRVCRNEENVGLPLSLNKALKMALGRYVVRVDSDDYVHREFLSLSRMFMNMNREYQAVAVDYSYVDEFETFIEKKNCMEEEIACGIMFRKECLFDVGLYDERYRMREGHDLRRRFLEKFQIGRLELPLYKYRKHEENRTNQSKIVAEYDQQLASDYCE